jgi:phage regulator Rha-like protein
MMADRKQSVAADLIPQEIIESKILLIRGERVMLDSDLAALYDVETKHLKRAVRRNSTRFPEDFMFQLTQQEYNSLRCQIGTLKRGAHAKYLPYVFTEHGVAMLSSVLNSLKAVQINIQIIRAFVRIRTLLATHKDLQKRIDDLEAKLTKKMEEKFGVYDEQFKIVFQAFEEIKLLLSPPGENSKRKIGFH